MLNLIWPPFRSSDAFGQFPVYRFRSGSLLFNVKKSRTSYLRKVKRWSFRDSASGLFIVAVVGNVQVCQNSPVQQLVIVGIFPILLYCLLFFAAIITVELTAVPVVKQCSAPIRFIQFVWQFLNFVVKMSAKLRRRTPSPKTVTFDPSPPTTLERTIKRLTFKSHAEWEHYLSKYATRRWFVDNNCCICWHVFLHQYGKIWLLCGPVLYTIIFMIIKIVLAKLVQPWGPFNCLLIFTRHVIVDLSILISKHLTK